VVPGIAGINHNPAASAVEALIILGFPEGE
jgi:hypothetical protein